MGPLLSTYRCCADGRKPKFADAEANAVPRRIREAPKLGAHDWTKVAVSRRQKRASGAPGDASPSRLSTQQFAWVEQAISGEVAVVVSDLSGFTKMTRKYGIQHFASIIVRKRQLCLPILHHYKAVHIGTEADNLIVVFEDVCNAAKAALEMQRVLKEHGEEIMRNSPDRDHFKIPLNGIGVHCGNGLLVDKCHGLHGEAFAFAYQIGEDLTDKGQVLFSEAVRRRVEQDPFFAGVLFEPIEQEECELKLFSVEGELTGTLLGEQVPTADARFLHQGLLILAQRHDAGTDVEKLDSDIKENCMMPYTVLMFNFDTLNAGDMQDQVALKFQGIDVMKPVAEKHGGNRVEEALWIFREPLCAVKAALELRKTIQDYNARQSAESKRLHVRGYGLHMGQLLFIDGTDIHWGDPVNTSSKLGQDLAKGGDILVTPQVEEAVKQDASWAQASVHLLPRKLYRSGVELPCSSVLDGSEHEAAKQACSFLLDSQVGEGALESLAQAAALAESVDVAKLPELLRTPLRLPAILHLGVRAKRVAEGSGELARLPLTGCSFNDHSVLTRALRYSRFAAAAVLGGLQEDIAARVPGLAASGLKHVQQASGDCPLFFVADDPESNRVVLCVQGAATAPENHEKSQAGLASAAEKVAAIAWPVLEGLLQAPGGGAAAEPKRAAFVGHGFGAGVATLLALRALGAAAGQPAAAWAVEEKPSSDTTLDGFTLSAERPRRLECFAFGPPPCLADAAGLEEDACRCIFSFVNGFDCVPRSSPWAAAKLRQLVVQSDGRGETLEDLLREMTLPSEEGASSYQQPPAGQASAQLPEECKQGLLCNVVGTVVLLYRDTGLFSGMLGQEANWNHELHSAELLQLVQLHPDMLKDHLLENYTLSLEAAAASSASVLGGLFGGAGPTEGGEATIVAGAEAGAQE